MMRLSTISTFILLIVVILVSSILSGQEVKNPLFSETKIKNYLPHMTWKDVEALSQVTDMAIIPVGSIEQHGKQRIWPKARAH